MRRSGFTLVELMIVVGIIAIIAGIAVPNLLSARLSANETSAVQTLRGFTTAQQQFKTGAFVDLDLDGAGEFGFLRELAGAHGLRESTDGATVGEELVPATLSASFRYPAANGTVARSGYVFRIFLPRAGGTAAQESAAGDFSGSIDNGLSETFWCAYAWPMHFGGSGRHTHFVAQEGEITTTLIDGLEGRDALDASTAGWGFQQGGAVDSITGRPAIATTGRSGTFWRRVK